MIIPWPTIVITTVAFLRRSRGANTPGFHTSRIAHLGKMHSAKFFLMQTDTPTEVKKKKHIPKLLWPRCGHRYF